uniref:histidine kinase n=1 Tax=Desulfatirhabdium butyrativorans TaxID=340467 RepID=A0A7C4MMD8_9BACT
MTDSSNQKIRLLYVDDDRENLTSFKAVFRRKYEVYLAESAKQALEILKETDIQVLITDQRMPEMKGSDLLEMVAERYPQILRYMLTGYSDFDPLVDAINKGRLQGYFSKPIDPDFIISRIEDGLQRHYLQWKNQILLEELQQREMFLNAIFEHIPDMIVVKDAGDLRFLRLNRSAESILGYRVEEMIGKTDYDVFPKEEADFFAAKDHEVLKGGKLVDIPEEPIQHADSSIRWLHTKKIPIQDASGAPRYLLGVSRDITAIKALREKEKLLENRLNQAQKMEAIGLLAGGIAHDFNNILMAIIGYSKLALNSLKKGSAIETYIRQVYDAGNRAKNLVQQILTIARRQSVEKKPVQVCMIAKEAIRFLRSSIPASIEIQTDWPSKAYVLADPGQIHQIFMNLCTNAVQAMETGIGVLGVTVRDHHVDVSRSAETGLDAGEYVRITISDTGKGIPEEQLNMIFEPYFTTKEKGVGTGLGLSIVHGIVKSYGGEISVQSQPGIGTTFTIDLPKMVTKEWADAESEEELLTGSERILLIDDEETIVQLSKEMLTTLGYRVTAMTQSKMALDLFRKNPLDYDLVVTDMTMPGMTGDLLAQECIKIRPDIPVILCTGFNRQINESRIAALGIRCMLLKPISIDVFSKTVRKVLDEANIQPTTSASYGLGSSVSR